MHSASRTGRTWIFTLTLSLTLISCATEVGKQGATFSEFRLQPSTPATVQKPSAASTAIMQAEYGKLPLSFETNQGQSDEQVKFLARGSGYTLFLTATEAVLTLRQKPEGRSQEPTPDP